MLPKVDVKILWNTTVGFLHKILFEAFSGLFGLKFGVHTARLVVFQILLLWLVGVSKLLANTRVADVGGAISLAGVHLNPRELSRDNGLLMCECD